MPVAGERMAVVEVSTVVPPQGPNQGDVHVVSWSLGEAKQTSSSSSPPSSGAAVVMLHGFTQTNHSFVDAAPLLLADMPRGTKVHSVSLRGHGKSAWTETYTRHEMAADVVRAVDDLGVGSFFLVGMSLGASISVEVASMLGKRVKSLVLVDWAPIDSLEGMLPRGVEAILALFARRWDTFEEAVQEMHAFNPRRSIDNIRDRLRHQLQLAHEDGKEVYRWATDPKLIESLAADAGRSQWDTVRKLSVPCLLVRGAMSDVLSPERAKQLVDAIPGCKFAEVSGAGHSVAGDNPRGFAEVVAPFFAAAAPPGAGL